MPDPSRLLHSADRPGTSSPEDCDVATFLGNTAGLNQDHVCKSPEKSGNVWLSDHSSWATSTI